jgi:anti-sigma regulatory factor (Ser/Thr protein kinase)
MRFILKFRSADGIESDIEMALYEALANAVTHGNGENSHKRVYVGCRRYMNYERGSLNHGARRRTRIS